MGLKNMYVEILRNIGFVSQALFLATNLREGEETDELRLF